MDPHVESEAMKSLRLSHESFRKIGEEIKLAARDAEEIMTHADEVGVTVTNNLIRRMRNVGTTCSICWFGMARIHGLDLAMGLSKALTVCLVGMLVGVGVGGYAMLDQSGMAYKMASSVFGVQPTVQTVSSPTPYQSGHQRVLPVGSNFSVRER